MKNDSPITDVIYVNNPQQPDNENILLRPPGAEQNSAEVRTRTFSGQLRAPHIIIEAPPKPEVTVSNAKQAPSNGHGPKKVISNGTNDDNTKLPVARKVKKKKNTVARPPDGKFVRA